jgi:pimeloyl-ACP methyl ester carboxylesterase
MVGRFFRGILVFAAILIFAVIGLLVVFSDPDVRDLEAREKYANPPSQFITLPSGATVHYRDQGQRNAPTLVLLHGSIASLHTWEPWVNQMGDQFRIISLDLPGHGLTGAVPSDDYSQEAMTGFVNEFTTVMNIQRFALAGNSMGGAVAARFAIRHPERLTALVLVNAAGMPTRTARDAGLGFTIARLPVIQNVMLYVSPRSLFEQGLKKAFSDDALVTQEMVDRYWILNRKTGNRAATLKRFQTPVDNVVQENAERITTPTLILWGDQDSLTPPDIGQAYNAAIKGSRLVVFRNTGHVPMEEVPEQSARVVREFLAPQSIGLPPSQ